MIAIQPEVQVKITELGSLTNGYELTYGKVDNIKELMEELADKNPDFIITLYQDKYRIRVSENYNGIKVLQELKKAFLIESLTVITNPEVEVELPKQGNYRVKPITNAVIVKSDDLITITFAGVELSKLKSISNRIKTQSRGLLVTDGLESSNRLHITVSNNYDRQEVISVLKAGLITEGLTVKEV